MSIVDWKIKGDLTPKTSNKARKQIFQTLLQREITEHWEGKISRRGGQYEKTVPPRVEIRKHLGDANVLIVVGNRNHDWMNRTPLPEMITCVSMNGTAVLTEDDFLEMGLASAEAVGMFKAVIEKDAEENQ